MKIFEHNFKVKLLKNLYENENLEEDEIIPILLIQDEKGEWYTFQSIGEKLVKSLLAYYDLIFLKRLEGKNEIFHFYKDKNNFIYLLNLKEDELIIATNEPESEVRIPIYQINFGYFESTTFYKLPFDYFLLDEKLQQLNYNNLKDLKASLEIYITLPDYIL
jgi:hypothetical protein